MCSTAAIDGALEVGPPEMVPKPDPSHRYRRPYEGTELDDRRCRPISTGNIGLVEQLRRDASHGFFVI